MQPMIDTAMPILRMMRHGDGGLGLFHGGHVEGAERVNRILVQSGETSPAPGHAENTGFMRLSAGRVNVLFDTGDPPSGRHARTAHAAPLALEVSIGRRRVITNCGSGMHLDPEWETGCRSSSAHSTLTLADHSPAQFSGSSKTPLRRLVSPPQVFEKEREEDEDGVWALAAHDGYVAQYGLLHYRRLFLSPEGTDMRGEDTLSLVKGGAKTLERARAKRKTPDGPGFAVRFHLHPDVEAEATEKAVLLTLASGERWRMLQSGGTLSLEDSIYIPSPGAPRATKQIVIQAVMQDDGGQVRWALKRLESEAEARDFTAEAPPQDGPPDPVTAPKRDASAP